MLCWDLEGQTQAPCRGHCVSEGVFTAGSSYQALIRRAAYCSRRPFSYSSGRPRHQACLARRWLLGPTLGFSPVHLEWGSEHLRVWEAPVHGGAAGPERTLGDLLVERRQRQREWEGQVGKPRAETRLGGGCTFV